MRPCSLPSCEKPHFGRGFCRAHYERWRVYGTPMETKPLATANGEARLYLDNVVVPYASDDCLIWPYKRHADGYAYLGSKLASRVICEETKGLAPSRLHHAAHSCGNGKGGCVNPRHLSWKTQVENEADKLSHGTRVRGSAHKRSKLTESQIREIRSSQTLSCRTLAERHGVSVGHVRKIRKNETWAWMEDAV